MVLNVWSQLSLCNGNPAFVSQGWSAVFRTAYSSWHTYSIFIPLGLFYSASASDLLSGSILKYTTGFWLFFYARQSSIKQWHRTHRIGVCPSLFMSGLWDLEGLSVPGAWVHIAVKWWIYICLTQHLLEYNSNLSVASVALIHLNLFSVCLLFT